MKIVSLKDIEKQAVSHDPSIEKKVIARKHDIPHITQVAQAILKPGDKVSEHYHQDLYEVFFLQSGEMTAVINGEKITIKAGSVTTIEPNDRHQFENNSDEPIVLFYFGVEI